MSHDYHCTAAISSRAARTCSDTSSTSAGRSRDAWAVLPTRIREEIIGLLGTTSSAFTRAPTGKLLQCCRRSDDLEVDFERGLVRWRGEVWVRAYPYRSTKGHAAIAQSEAWRSSTASSARAVTPDLRVDPRRTEQERAAGFLRVHLSRAAPRVSGSDHFHGTADAVATDVPSTPST